METICRICLDKSATISVFDKHEDVQYCVKIMRCVSVYINEGDGLPDCICETCASDLSISYEFIQRCEASDKALRCLDIIQTKNESDIEDTKDEPLQEVFKEEQLPVEIEQFEDLIDNVSDLVPVEEEPKEKIVRAKKKVVRTRVRKKRNVFSTKNTEVICTICNYKAPSPSALVLHIRKHTKEKPYSCDMCAKPFSSKSSMKKHKDRHTRGSVIINTNKPKNPFDKRKNRPKTGPLQCVLCGVLAMSRSAYEYHMRIHTGEKPFACEICDARFISNGALKRHVEIYHSEREKKFICETCGNSFFRKTEIITHLRVHTGEKPYMCPYCPRGFGQISSLIRHKRTHTGERPYKCNICMKSFADKSLLVKHKTVHSNERKHSCHLCNKPFKTKSAMHTHLKLHSNQKRNICNLCGMTFSLKGNLKTHMRRIHSEKSGHCTICQKTYSDLEVHMRKHTGEKPYVCKLCDQGFATKRSHSHHMSFKHENATKYKCSIGGCTRTFPTATMLEFHILKHTNNTPFVCQYCSRGFFRTCDLSRHLRVGHMNMPVKVENRIPNSATNI